VSALVAGAAWSASASDVGSAAEFAPIETLPKEFPRFYTPITGAEVTLHVSPQAPVPICLPNPDESGATLTPGARLTLFGLTDEVEDWGAFGAADVSEDGTEICTLDGGGVVVSGTYVVAIRTSDLVPGLEDVVEGLGEASPIEPSRLFCNVFTEFLCNRACGVAYSARLSACSARFLSCQAGCGSVNLLFRPACRAVCTTQSGVCTANASLERRQCRRNCLCR
jgi:hypothetical protein